MHFILIILILSLYGCIGEERRVENSPKKFQPQGNRYEVTLKDPPIIFENAAAMIILPKQFPLVVVADWKGQIYKSRPIDEQGQKGLGPSFSFIKDHKARNENWFNGAIKFSYRDNQVRSEKFFTNENEYMSIMNFSAQDFLFCEISVSKGLSCAVDCNNSPDGPCAAENIWSDLKNPVVEVNTTSHPGNYAMTENGTLFYFMRERREISDAHIIHSDIKFRKNRHGRYFINTDSDAACLQSEDFAVYCSEVYRNQAHSSYGPTSKEWPQLSKVVQLEFPVEQATFSGRHYCFLSETGDVYCMGDNRCGQITGRHDEISEFNEPKKLDFLKYPATGIAVYPGGSCVVLNNGQVQCLGLGASVLRTRRWPKEAYRKSFSWLHGFRPYQICGGGAENGI